MSLPKINSATYSVTIPSTKKEVKFRPFVVREQKALLIAQQSADVEVMLDTLKGVIASCIVTKINVDDLATFDIEYLFTQIRAKSVGEVSELLFTCDECENEVKISFDLTTLEVLFDDTHSKKIEITDSVGMAMKYPDMTILKMLENYDENDVNVIFNIVVDCIDYIYEGDKINYAKEQTRDDLEEFLNSLNSEQFNSITSFFKTMPRLQQNVDFTCPKCKKAHTKILKGLSSFF